jgi:hypothetical protein
VGGVLPVEHRDAPLARREPSLVTSTLPIGAHRTAESVATRLGLVPVARTHARRSACVGGRYDVAACSTVPVTGCPSLLIFGPALVLHRPNRLPSHTRAQAPQVSGGHHAQPGVHHEDNAGRRRRRASSDVRRALTESTQHAIVNQLVDKVIG